MMRACRQTRAAKVSYSRLFKTQTSVAKGEIIPSPVVDIHFFKKSLVLHYQHLYAKTKRLNRLYRVLFYGFSLLFAGFAVAIFVHTVNDTFGFYFGDLHLVKDSVNAICVLLAGAAFFAGQRIAPEEAARSLVISRIEEGLSCPAKETQIEFNALVANLD